MLTECQGQGPVHPFLLSRTSKASCEVPELNELEHFMTVTQEDHRCGEHFAHQKAWVTNLQACSLNISHHRLHHVKYDGFAKVSQFTSKSKCCQVAIKFSELLVVWSPGVGIPGRIRPI